MGEIIWPVPPKPGSTPYPFDSLQDFGPRVINGQNGYHQGLDFGRPSGTEISAIAAGRVIEKDNDHAIYGTLIRIQHTGTNYVSLYGHMLAGSTSHLQLESNLAQGQKVGRVGATGVATGNHLHLGIWINGALSDPLPFILNRLGGTPTDPTPTRRARNRKVALYHDQSTLVNGSVVSGTTLFALAGDGLGDAAWLETKTYTLATAWSAQIGGSSALLSHQTFLDFKAKYLLGAGGTP